MRYAEALMALQCIPDALREYHRAADKFLDAGDARKARAVYAIILSHDANDSYAQKQRDLCDVLCLDTDSEPHVLADSWREGVVPRTARANATTQTAPL